MTAHRPTAMCTACLILVVAAFLQCRKGEATLFNTLLLVLGVVSVINHSRLDTPWNVDDAVHWIDVLLILLVGWCLLKKHCTTVPLLTVSVYAATIYAAHAYGAIPTGAMADWWASVHVFFCVALLMRPP